MQIPNKDIFQYWNGERGVFGDPLLICHHLTIECDGDIDAVYKLAQSENALQSIPAQWRLIAAARKAFKMIPHCEETNAGANNEIVYSVLESFNNWWAKKKASTDNSPTLPPPTDSPALSITMPFAASGPISPESDSNAPQNP